jgi:hypothetical protein
MSIPGVPVASLDPSLPTPRQGSVLTEWPAGHEGRWTLWCHRTVEAVPVRLGRFRCPACGAEAGIDDCCLVMLHPDEVEMSLAELLWDGGVVHAGAGVGVA